MEENNRTEGQHAEEVFVPEEFSNEGNAPSGETVGNQGQSDSEALQKQVDDLKDKYLRLVADFDNFRKRSAKERYETIQTASKDLITALLPVLDDSERAEKQMQLTQDIEAVKEGQKLVFSKLRATLQSTGLKAMETIGTDFNPEFHEAITEIPAPNPSLKGKVIDEVEKGYYLNDKIIRFAKVVVGK